MRSKVSSCITSDKEQDMGRGGAETGFSRNSGTRRTAQRSSVLYSSSGIRGSFLTLNFVRRGRKASASWTVTPSSYGRTTSSGQRKHWKRTSIQGRGETREVSCSQISLCSPQHFPLAASPPDLHLKLIPHGEGCFPVSWTRAHGGCVRV